MVYQQAQFFCPLASFSCTATLGTRQAFVLLVYAGANVSQHEARAILREEIANNPRVLWG